MERHWLVASLRSSELCQSSSCEVPCVPYGQEQCQEQPGKEAFLEFILLVPYPQTQPHLTLSQHFQREIADSQCTALPIAGLSKLCKGPGKYSRLYGPCGLNHDYSTLCCSMSGHRQYVNDWAWLCSNKTLWTPKFKFYVILMCHRIFFFQPFKNAKAILSSLAIQEQAIGPIHSPGYGLPTSALVPFHR